MSTKALEITKMLLTENELSALIGVKVRTIQRWRLLGVGPRYRKLIGSVRYPMHDLEAWLESCETGGGGVWRPR